MKLLLGTVARSVIYSFDHYRKQAVDFFIDLARRNASPQRIGQSSICKARHHAWVG